MSSTVAVIGAGAFGGWTALFLKRAGFNVVLADAFGPGNGRASSGGETRVLRMGYGGDRNFFDMAVRSRHLWLEEQKRFREPVYFETGCLWMLEDEGKFFRDSLPQFEKTRLPLEEFTPASCRKIYPQINVEGVRAFFLERQAGYLKARRACEHVVEAFVNEGGLYQSAQVLPLNETTGPISEVTLANGERLGADLFVFACGPWLPRVLPSAIKNNLNPTRQEVFYFGTPPGRADLEELPVWINLGPDKFFYGIPKNEGRGFKVADDTRGAGFDPDQTDRIITPVNLKRAREFMENRFPDLKGAPLVESRVCQYEDTPDRNFIMGQAKHAPNVWIAGGGSGHGFKHGPAVGEMMANAIAKGHPIPSEFSPDRFN